MESTKSAPQQLQKVTKPVIKLIATSKVIESPHNPRKHADPVKQANITASMKTRGQLTIALVRPVSGGKFELAAGHRRLRGAKAAGIPLLRCEVRPMEDAEFYEILGIENDEREDIHPLDQAAGYKLLMTKSGYDIAKIATRINRDETYVYDRLALLKLNPDLKELFFENRFTLSHAVILAKLSPDEQKKAAARPDRHDARDSGLWRDSEPTLDETSFPLVAKTAKELEAWITRNIRFDETKIVVDELFPKTGELLAAAEETGARVIAITYDTFLPPSIERDPNEKIYTRNFWERADGEQGSKTCDSAVVGIIKAGKGRGDAMGVCINRDRCTTHWSAHVKARLAREKAKKAGTPLLSAKHGTVDAATAKRERAKLLKANIAKSKFFAGIEAITVALGHVAKAPTKAQVAHAVSVLSGKENVRTMEQLIVGYAIDSSVDRSLAWALRQRTKQTYAELQVWGVDAKKVLASATAVTCIFCGCSEENACQIKDGEWNHKPCQWLTTEPRVCTNPDCVAQSKGDAPSAMKASQIEDVEILDDQAQGQSNG